MPLSAVTTYVPTIDEFHRHWEKVNAASSKPMTLRGGVTIAHLEAIRHQLLVALNYVVSKENIRIVAVGDRDLKRSELRERFAEFRDAASRRPLSKLYKSGLPKTPSLASGDEGLIAALEAIVQPWVHINHNNPPIPKFRPPLLLSGGYSLERFGNELGTYRNACRAAETADVNVVHARSMRREHLVLVAKALRLYRSAVGRHLGDEHELSACIPDLEPDEAKMPEAPVIEVEWVEEKEKALITWTYPDGAGLKRFALRYHPGPRYKNEEEESVESIPPDQSEVWVGYGLAASGSNATFKLYAVATDGGEAGSNTVRVVRP